MNGVWEKDSEKSTSSSEERARKKHLLLLHFPRLAFICHEKLCWKGTKSYSFLQIAENHKRSIKMCALMDKRPLENENPYTLRQNSILTNPQFLTKFEFPAKHSKVLKLNLNLVMFSQTWTKRSDFASGCQPWAKWCMKSPGILHYWLWKAMREKASGAKSARAHFMSFKSCVYKWLS